MRSLRSCSEVIAIYTWIQYRSMHHLSWASRRDEAPHCPWTGNALYSVRQLVAVQGCHILEVRSPVSERVTAISDINAAQQLVSVNYSHDEMQVVTERRDLSPTITVQSAGFSNHIPLRKWNIVIIQFITCRYFPVCLYIRIPWILCCIDPARPSSFHFF